MAGDELRFMRVLITGAFGFVGKNLSAELAARGHRLIALDVAQQVPSAYSEFLTWADLEHIERLDADAVIHLAGKAHDVRNASDSKIYFDINVGLTKRIAERFLASQAKVFIQFSSVKAVADRVPGEVLTEEETPVPQTAYGASKLEAERHLQSVGFPAGRRLYILRPCMIHGPGNKGNLNLLFNVVKRGIPWPLGAFENKRSFASVQNVCAVVAALLEGQAESGVYQVADDEALSTNELIGAMAVALGRQARVWNLPAGLVRKAARLGDVLHLPLNSERLKKLTESYVVSNGKIKRALGWERMPVEAGEGMRQTLLSFSRNSARP